MLITGRVNVSMLYGAKDSGDMPKYKVETELEGLGTRLRW